MPLYDYECPKCGTIKEVQHSVSEIGNIEILCDDCRKPMKKMLSLPALIGFDNVGRSLSKKDRDEATKENISPAKENAPAAKDTKNESATKVETKKKSAN